MTEDQPDPVEAVGGDDIDEDRLRNTVVGLFLVTLVASAIPAFTPLPAGYLYGGGALVVGASAIYLFVYRRIQEELTRELATLRRLVAGLAAAFLVYTVFNVLVAILSIDGVVPAGDAVAVVWVAAASAGVAAAVVADPERLVWFVAAVFVLNLAIREVVAASGTRLVVGDTSSGLLVYLGLLVPTVAAAYLLVYRGVAERVLTRLR